MSKLENTRIALLATDGFEDSELTKPLERLNQEHASVTVISLSEGVITGKNGTIIDVATTVNDVKAEDFAGLLLPGGVANPDTMRLNDKAIAFIKDFFE